VVRPHSPDYVAESVEYGDTGTCYAAVEMEGLKASKFSVCIGGHPLGVYTSRSGDSTFEIYHIFMNTDPWKTARARETFSMDLGLDLPVEEDIPDDFCMEYELKPGSDPTPIQVGFPADGRKESKLVRQASRLAAEMTNSVVPDRWNNPETLLEEFRESDVVDVFDVTDGESLPGEFGEILS